MPSYLFRFKASLLNLTDLQPTGGWGSFNIKWEVRMKCGYCDRVGDNFMCVRNYRPRYHEVNDGGPSYDDIYLQDGSVFIQDEEVNEILTRYEVRNFDYRLDHELYNEGDDDGNDDDGGDESGGGEEEGGDDDNEGDESGGGEQEGGDGDGEGDHEDDDDSDDENSDDDNGNGGSDENGFADYGYVSDGYEANGF
ncbi:hypothetical protein AAC387_Pa04g1445 [Persea americana]